MEGLKSGRDDASRREVDRREAIVAEGLGEWRGEL